MPDCCVAKYGGYTDGSYEIIGRTSTLVIMKLTKTRATDWVITMPQTGVGACGVSHKGSGLGILVMRLFRSSDVSNRLR